MNGRKNRPVRPTLFHAVNAFQPCRAPILYQLAGEQGHHVIPRLGKMGSGTVDLRSLLQGLQDLGKLTFRTGQLEIAGKPFRVHGFQHPANFHRLLLGAVVLPKLGPGVFLMTEGRVLTQGTAVLVQGQHGGRGEIHSHADDVFRLHAAFPDHAGNGGVQRLLPVRRVL